MTVFTSRVKRGPGNRSTIFFESVREISYNYNLKFRDLLQKLQNAQDMMVIDGIINEQIANICVNLENEIQRVFKKLFNSHPHIALDISKSHYILEECFNKCLSAIEIPPDKSPPHEDLSDGAKLDLQTPEGIPHCEIECIGLEENMMERQMILLSKVF